jgi:hypothetical protein
MAAITESSSIAAVMDLAKTLEASAQYDLAMTLLSNLKGWMGGEASGKRKRKQRKQKDPNAPKREVKPDSYIALVNKHVWPILDEMSKVDGLDADAKKQMRSVRARTQIGKMLWDARVEPADDKAAAIASLTRDQIVAVFEEWKINPPVKDESAKAKKSKLAGMTDEEKAAFFKARGAKAAAARAAKKAAAGETKSKPADDDDDASSVSSAESSDSDNSDGESEAEAEEEVKPTVWEHAMKGADKPTKYERIDVDGKVFLYDLKTKKFLGQWDEKKNKIDSKVEDPCA